jgi:hypothetical protein
VNLNGGAVAVRAVTPMTGGKRWAVRLAIALLTACGDSSSAPVQVATIEVLPTTATMRVGTTQPFDAVVRDAQGAPLVGRPMVWVTSDPSRATVDRTGVVSAIAPGAVTVTASSDGRVGSALVSVVSAALALNAISPATMTAGAPAAILGAGFSNVPGESLVTVRGVPASVVSATDGRLDVIIPCVEPGVAEVTVTVGSTRVRTTHPVVVHRLVIPVGQATILTSASESACNELPASSTFSRYLVTVFSAATSPQTVAAAELTGNTAPVAASTAASVTAGQPLATAIPVLDETDHPDDRVHFAFLERNRREYERLMSASRDLPAASRIAGARVSAPPVAVGDARDFFFTYIGGCGDTTRVIRAKAVRIGTRSIIWEDAANALPSGTNASLAGYFDRLGQIFDQEQYAIIRDAFGDPLLRDAATDADGKIHLVFSQRVNGVGTAAYVTVCDQFPTSAAAGSNVGQVLYGAVPVVSAPGLDNADSPDGWFYFMGRTIVHELKHIAAHSARVALGAPTFEQSWLEEGTARHAEELWARASLYHVAWRGNTGFGSGATNGLYCDFHPADLTCAAADPLHRPSYGLRRHFDEMRNKLVQPWNWSPFGEVSGQSGAVFYNTTWSLVRYAIDRFATSESVFLRALTATTSTGMANLTTVAGASVEALIGGWGLALYADDYPGLEAPSADVQFSTWNLRDVYAGLHAAPAWAVRWPTTFPITPAPLSFGSFVVSTLGIRGGSHAYFELAGVSDRAQLLSLRTSATAPLDANLRLAITRLQ